MSLQEYVKDAEALQVLRGLPRELLLIRRRPLHQVLRVAVVVVADGVDGSHLVLLLLLALAWRLDRLTVLLLLFLSFLFFLLIAIWRAYEGVA